MRKKKKPRKDKDYIENYKKQKHTLNFNAKCRRKNSKPKGMKGKNQQQQQNSKT